MLNQIRMWIPDSILRIGNLLEWHRKTKLLAKPPACRGKSLLTRTWMTATGIRPTLRKVVFTCSPLLQQKLAIRIGDQNGEGPMQLSVAMRIDLAIRADLIIPGVDQNYGFTLVTKRIFTFDWLCSHLNAP
jgi:hypothetical protein